MDAFETIFKLLTTGYYPNTQRMNICKRQVFTMPYPDMETACHGMKAWCLQNNIQSCTMAITSTHKQECPLVYRDKTYRVWMVECTVENGIIQVYDPTLCIVNISLGDWVNVFRNNVLCNDDIVFSYSDIIRNNLNCHNMADLGIIIQAFAKNFNSYGVFAVEQNKDFPVMKLIGDTIIYDWSIMLSPRELYETFNGQYTNYAQLATGLIRMLIELSNTPEERRASYRDYSLAEGKKAFIKMIKEKEEKQHDG